MMKSFCQLSLCLALAASAANAQQTIMVNENPTIGIIGPWQIEVEGVKMEVPVPQTVRVVDERYDTLPFYQKAGGWNDGIALNGVAATGCSLPMALDSYSVVVRMTDGTLLLRGQDYDYNDRWGTLGRFDKGRISQNTPVLISYRYTPMRLDSVIRNPQTGLRLECGTPAAFCPKAPALAEGETRICNILTDAQTDKLVRENIFPILETECPSESASAQQAFIPKTMKKLQNGEKIRILAWGDSVTECGYIPDEFKWQEQFVRRLRSRFPNADIELISNGWGGRTIPAFLGEPAGSQYNFAETVLGTNADLVISEFVNDAGLPASEWERSFNIVFKAFQEKGMEWIILTPHYVRPDWMGLTSQNGPAIEQDPRPYVAFIRKFTAEQKVALADAAKRYGRLWRQGIPYNTLMTNTINHPDKDGMKIFADALMSIFE